jgi:pyruvate dehydrogenase E2 component (dihydrolipoamide acetyltransferase)
MAKYVIMPKLGFNMREGKIVEWLKHEGEKVQEQEVILQIETDKSVIEVESQISGILRKILVDEGEIVPVTMPIGIIADQDEVIDEIVQEALKKLGDIGKRESKQQEKQSSKELPEKDLHHDEEKPETIKISPRARKKAQELGLDLQLVKNEFSKKVILAEDIIEFSKQKRISEAHIVTQKPQADGKVIAKEEPYSGMRKIIGDRLSQSKFSAPHIYFTNSVDMTNALKLLELIKTNKEIDVSINDLLIFTTVRALMRHPQLNSSLVNDRIVYFSNVNIGIAVGLEDGLIVPVLKEAESKSIVEIATESKRLISLAKEKKLLPEDYQNGTFTISNLGMFDIEQFTAIINPPESAILAVGSIRKKPIVEDNGNISIRPMMKMTLSVDHRVIDGKTAAIFLRKIKEYLNYPSILFIR